MTQEEILIKLGLDAGTVSPGLKKAGQEVEQFSEKAHKSFLHAGSAGKGFHRILEQITEQSPLVGNAIRFALSPIVGVFAGALFVFKNVKEELENMERLFEKIGDIMSDPIGNAKGAAEGAKKTVSLMRQEIEAFNNAQEKHELKQIEYLQSQLAIINQTFRVRKEMLGLQVQVGDITKVQGEQGKKKLDEKQAEAEFHAKAKAYLDVSAARVKSSTELNSAEREATDENRARLLDPEGLRKTISDLERQRDRLKETRKGMAQQVADAEDAGAGLTWDQMTPKQRLLQMNAKEHGEGTNILQQDRNLASLQSNLENTIEHHKEVLRRAEIQERSAKVRLKAAQDEYAELTAAQKRLDLETEEARLNVPSLLAGPRLNARDKWLADLVTRYGPRSIPATDLARLQKIQGLSPDSDPRAQEAHLRDINKQLDKLNQRAAGEGIYIIPQNAP